MSTALRRVTAEGFRSLRHVEIELGSLTALIGPNGAGKSNFLSLLKLIPLLRTQSLRRFVAAAGGASNLLYYGPQQTQEISIKLDFDTSDAQLTYAARLGHAHGDRLVFLDELVGRRAAGATADEVISLGVGHAESHLEEAAAAGPSFIGDIRTAVSRMNFFHFHDTSPTAPLRQSSRSAEASYLRSDGVNLAAVLRRLASGEHDEDRAAWRRITHALQMIAPYIKRLDPAFIDDVSSGSGLVRLYWWDQRDHRFDVDDLSDGTLRALAIITSLCQPISRLPSFICIDEPELGLHPAALGLVVGLARSVAPYCQVVLATQSARLLDEFEPEEVVVVERDAHATRLRRLDVQSLEEWLDEYRLSDLYDKNVLGGRP